MPDRGAGDAQPPDGRHRADTVAGVRPEDIVRLELPGRPALAADGSVVVAVTRPDTELDRYASVLRVLPVAGPPFELTVGPRDSSPVLSPDGHTVIFLRAPETGPAQLHQIDLHGGEARQIASHPLGAGTPVFSESGAEIAYLAQVPEAGRYGTDPAVSAEGEPPRLIDRLSYRRDGRGFLLDKPEQLFVLALASGAEPRQVTDEPLIVDGPLFLPDGSLGYVRITTADLPGCEFASVLYSPGPPPPGVLLTRLRGDAAHPIVVGESICYLGAEFDGVDVAGRTTGLWSLPVAGGAARRLTDHDVEVDGFPVALQSAVLVTVFDRGSGSLRAVDVSADHAPLSELTVVVGGHRVVTSFTAAAAGGSCSTVAAVVADPVSPGEVLTVEVSGTGVPHAAERVLTELAADLGSTVLGRHLEIEATAPDGYPVHGFLVLPTGPGPHPVLLVVHGGPHAAYGWGLFDEAQIYATAGYAVVLPNPRGSAGYGHEHGRTVRGRLGTVDMDDVLALLDAVLSRPDCDPARVGVMGGSYGGFMTSWLASHAPERFTAAISERAVNAWDSFDGSSDIGYYFTENYVGADRESQWQASPLAYADDIALPLLIIHSEDDWRCPVEQGQRLFVALKKRGAPVEMLLFPAEGHELSRSGRPRHRLQRFQAILGWWHRQLPVRAAS